MDVSDTNRRQFTARHSAGVEHTNYIEQPVFRVTEETRPQHALEVRYNAREQWGNAGVGLNYSQYLNDRSLWGGYNHVAYRITRELELYIHRRF